MKKLILLLLFAGCVPAFSQANVVTIPSASFLPSTCNQDQAWMVVTAGGSTAAIYTCQGNVPTLQGTIGSGGGSFTPGGDLSGNSTSQTVRGINNTVITSFNGLMNFSSGTPSAITPNASSGTELVTSQNSTFGLQTFAQLSTNFISPVTYGAKVDGQVNNNCAWVATNTTINCYQTVYVDNHLSTIGSGQSGTPSCSITGGAGPNVATCTVYLDGNGGCHMQISAGGSYTVAGGIPTGNCTATGGTPSVFVLGLVGSTWVSTDCGSSKVIYAVGQIATQVKAGVLNMAQQSMSGCTFVTANQITVTTAPTISNTSTVVTDTGKLYWGTIDTASYVQALNVALTTRGSSIVLSPGLSFIDACINQIPFPHPQSPIGFGGAIPTAPSTIVGVPNFTYNNKPSTGCLFYDPFTGGGNTISASGDYIQNVVFDGSSLGTITGVPSGTSLIWCQQCNATNVYLDAWGSNTGNLTGWSLNGVANLTNSGANGAGNTNCNVVQNSVGGFNYLSNSYCGQSTGNGLLVSGGTAVVQGASQMNTTTINGSGAVLNSVGNTYGGVTITNGVMNSDQDDLPSITAIAANGTLNMSRGITAGNVQISGGTFKADKSTLSGSFASIIFESGFTSTFIDGGGNTYAGGTNNIYYPGVATAVGGNFVSQDMNTGTCTGTATALSTLYLYGLGQTTATTCTGTALLGGQVQKHSGTLRTLWVNLGTAGGSSSSGVFTVYKNGSATALTCTTGATANCFDLTNAHEVAFNAGDVIAIGFTTILADTLANVTAGVYANWK